MCERETILLPMSSNEITNLQFEARINRVIPASARVKAFYAKVDGANQANPDGTSRSAIIENCKTFDILRLEPRSENPFAPDAVAVLSETGEQIGYLDTRLATDAKRNGARWMAVFRHRSLHPETGAVIGAVVYMIHLTEQFARERERKTTLKQDANYGQMVPESP
jgi:HIRAN domain